MNWLRTILLSAVAVLALAGPAFLPSTAQAHPQSCVTGQSYYPTVYYRSCPHDQWRVYGSYYRACDAAYAVQYFRYYGYEAFYR